MSSAMAVRDALAGVGYLLVQTEPRYPGLGSSVRPDVVAWASNAEGQLVPWAVVEVRRASDAPAEAALPQLAQTQTSLGTQSHYVVVGDRWYEADAPLLGVRMVDGPKPPEYPGAATLTDVTLATSLVREALWRELDRGRGRGASITDIFPAVLAGLSGGVHSAGGRISLDPVTLWQAARGALTDFGRDERTAAVASNVVVADAVARLAGQRLSGTVADPFCGTGSFLWAAADSALAREVPILLNGSDIDLQAVAVARSVLAYAPVPGSVNAADAFEHVPATADVVLCAPPMGMRLRQPYRLADSTSTNDANAAGVDTAVRRLAPGGRAVIQTSPAFASSSTLGQYRKYLASTFRVAALIGCPSGSVPGTRVGSILLVVDNRPPSGPTFVAQLGADWQAQLVPGGAALDAAVAHIDSLAGFL